MVKHPRLGSNETRKRNFEIGSDKTTRQLATTQRNEDVESQKSIDRYRYGVHAQHVRGFS